MTVKLTPKQLMLIIMSVLLVLTVAMSAIVVARVGNMVKGLGGPSMNKPPVVTPTGTQNPGQNTEPDPTESQAPTRPVVTDPDHEHEYKKSQTVAATCTMNGYTVYLCDCGASHLDDFHDPKGHKFGEEEVLEATCEKPGYRQVTCQRCGEVEVRETFEALEHDYELVEEQVLTCEQDGFKEYQCKYCHEVKREDEEKAQGHKWQKPSQIVSEPTEIAPGEEKKTCTVCGGTESVLIPPTGKLEIQMESLPNEVGKWTEYIFYVGTETNKNAYIYHVWIAAEHSNLETEFSASGLTVTFKDASGKSCQYVMEPYANETLTIAEDGTPSSEAPDLNEDTENEPTEEPTEGTTEGSDQGSGNSSDEEDET